MYSPEARQEAIQRVLEALASGVPLAVVCRSDGMPTAKTIREWADGDEELSFAIARAREEGFDVIAAECLDIADETGRDTIRTEAGERADVEWISRSKLRIETRLKLLAKWDPKRYGELVKLGNSDGGNFDLAGALAAGNARVMDAG